jgi:hypothetical protein
MTALVLIAYLTSEAPDDSGPLIACGKTPSRSEVAVRDHHKAVAFVEAVKNAGFEFSEDRPYDCGLELVARCGPDLDGDGKSDIIVRASWGQRYVDVAGGTNDADFAACHDRHFRGPASGLGSLFLTLSRDGRAPLGTVVVLEDQTGSGREGPIPITYTRWQGQPALTLHLTFYPSEGGLKKERERTVVARNGRLVVVNETPWRILPE